MPKPKTVTLDCAECGKSFEKVRGEHARRLREGAEKFFCSISCGAANSNSLKQSEVLDIKCWHCGTMFKAKGNSKTPIYCSRSCASSGSMTDYRRQKASETAKGLKHDAVLIAASLRSSQGWKYEEVEAYLKSQGIEHQFEVPLENRIFDLAIPSQKLYVEFDAKYHKYVGHIDKEKNELAEKHGWKVLRVKHDPNSVIRLKDFLEKFNPTSIGA
jgi:very-short-patch-repair endonuclease